MIKNFSDPIRVLPANLLRSRAISLPTNLQHSTFLTSNPSVNWSLFWESALAQLYFVSEV